MLKFWQVEIFMMHHSKKQQRRVFLIFNLLDVSFSFQGIYSNVAAVEDMRIKTLGASFY